MKKLFYLLLPLLASALMFGCTADNPAFEQLNTPAETIDPEVIAAIEAMGFSTDTILDKGDYYLVEGDIMLQKNRIGENLDTLQTRGGYYSYGTSKRLKDPYISHVRIAMASSTYNSNNVLPSEFRSRLSKAVTEWNNVTGTKLRFQLLPEGQDAPGLYDILVQKHNDNELGDQTPTSSDIPTSDGKAGQKIKINPSVMHSLSDAQWWSKIIHAIGHTVGFAHSVDSQGQPEEIPNVDGKEIESFMYLGNDGTFWSWERFNDSDKLAIRTLYPLNPAPTLTLSIYGPASGDIDQELTYKIMNGSTLLSATDYTLQWTANGGTVSGGSTGNQLKVKYSSSGSKTISVSVVHKASNHKYPDVSRTVNIILDFDPGKIAPSAQTINCGAIPAELTSSKDAFSIIGQVAYQWQSKTNTSSWTNVIQNGTSKNYQPGVLLITTYFRRKASAGSKSAYSNEVTINVIIPPLSGGTIGSDQLIAVGTRPDPLTNVSLARGGYGQLSYQWQMLVVGRSWEDMSSGYNNPLSLGISGISGTGTNSYRRKVTDETGQTAYSNAITITVVPQFTGGTISADNAIILQGIALRPTISGTPASGGHTGQPIIYQWQSKTANTGWTDIAGATNATYQSSSPLNQFTEYRRFARRGPFTAYSNTVAIYVADNSIGPNGPVGGIVTVQGVSTIPRGTAPGMIMNRVYPAGGPSAQYIWMSSTDQTNWTTISGATGESYQPPILNRSTSYRRGAIVNGRALISNTAPITVQ